MEKLNKPETPLSVLEQCALAHAIINENHEVVFLSDGATRYLGHSLLSEDALSLAADELRSVLEDALRLFFVEGRTAKTRAVRVQVEDEWRTVSVIVCSTHDLLASSKQALVIFNEYEHVSRTEAMLARAQKVANLGSWEYHLDTEEVIWSDQLYRIFGLDPELTQIDKKTILSIVPPEEHHLFDEALDQAVRGDNRISIEHRIHRPDGKERWILTQAETVCDREGKLVRLDGTALDITDRKRTEQTLTESEQRWRRLVEDLPEPVFISRDGVILYANAATVRMAGASSSEELVGRDLLEFVSPEQHERLRQRLAAIEHHGSVPPIEYEMRRKDGQIRIVESRGARIVYQGAPAIQSIMRDVTERRRADEALRKSEARSRAILMGIPDLIFRLSGEGIYLDIEAPGEAPLAAPAEELLGQNLSDILPEVVAERIQHAINTTLETRAMQRIEYPLVTIDGKEHEFEARITPIENDVLLLVRDITEKRQLEREILRISTLEQQRVGRDLHDMIGSHLTGVAMLAQSHTQNLEEGEVLSAREMAELTQLIRDAVEQVRALSRGLNPVKVEEQGLTAALHELADDTGKISGLRCRLKTAGKPPQIDTETSVQLYWIAQEAVTNVLRHAQTASVIDLQLKTQRNRLVLLIQDDGIGIPERMTEGMGISIMRFRADIIRATLSIERVPGGGTLVRCVLPLERISR